MILGVLYSVLGVWLGRLGPWATCRDAWASLTRYTPQERASHRGRASWVPLRALNVVVLKPRTARTPARSHGMVRFEGGTSSTSHMPPTCTNFARLLLTKFGVVS